jgi:hypothetical protein
MAVEDGMLVLLALVLAFRGYTKRDNPEPDWSGLIEFAGLIVTLSLLCLIPLPARQ